MHNRCDNKDFQGKTSFMGNTSLLLGRLELPKTVLDRAVSLYSLVQLRATARRDGVRNGPFCGSKRYKTSLEYVAEYLRGQRPSYAEKEVNRAIRTVQTTQPS